MVAAGDLIDTPSLSLESRDRKHFFYSLTLMTFRDRLFLAVFFWREGENEGGVCFILFFRRLMMLAFE